MGIAFHLAILALIIALILIVGGIYFPMEAKYFPIKPKTGTSQTTTSSYATTSVSATSITSASTSSSTISTISSTISTISGGGAGGGSGLSTITQTSIPLPPAGNVIFSDNFQEYKASSAPILNATDPPDANQYSPPHYNPNHAPLPEYWVPASSGGSSSGCVTRGGCVCWGSGQLSVGVSANCQMGPGTVFVVTTEQAPPGEKQSMKLGASDLYADKTSLGVNLNDSLFPADEPVNFTFMVWLSSGIDNPPAGNVTPNNVLTVNFAYTQIRYYGDNAHAGAGAWYLLTPSNILIPLGNYHLATENWHTVTLEQNWLKGVSGNRTWQALVIDGQQPFNITGQPAASVKTLPYDNFQIWIVPYADNQSITSAASDGYQPFYAYIGDVTITVG